MPLCALQERRGHAILMHRVDFVKVEHSPACGIEKPGPFALRALPFYQLARARVCNLNGTIIAHQVAIRVAREQQVGLSCERCKSTARTKRSIEKQPRGGVISLEKKLKKCGRRRGPFGPVLLGLGHHSYEDHAEVLRSKRIPAIPLQHD